LYTWESLRDFVSNKLWNVNLFLKKSSRKIVGGGGKRSSLCLQSLGWKSLHNSGLNKLLRIIWKLVMGEGKLMKLKKFNTLMSFSCTFALWLKVWPVLKFYSNLGGAAGLLCRLKIFPLFRTRPKMPTLLPKGWQENWGWGEIVDETKVYFVPVRVRLHSAVSWKLGRKTGRRVAVHIGYFS
jgi:hypothetical protein